ncbi:MAG: class I SAM-dependent RNA methyltransferase [Treponema sp.]|nr:class I SAM-dependent RNA methyltransferase [Treponema sp.]
MEEYTAVAFCAIGAERAVSNELKKISASGSEHISNAAQKKQLLYTVTESNFGRVRFKTKPEGLYRALFSLRAADRLLLEVGSFPADNFDSLFEATSLIPFEDFIPRGMGLKVSKVRSSASQLKAETSIQAVVHKASAQRLCNHYGIRRLPDVQDNGKQAELRVFIEKNKVSVLLDLSGEPLFKRGYRPAGGIAPLRESTAAAIILLSGWRRKFPLYDPFCGSGTIIIEAALYAWDQAPGLGRRFAISDLAIADKTAEENIRKELTEKIDYSRPICIMGSDADEKAITLAKANLKRALSLAGGKSRPCRSPAEGSGQDAVTANKIMGIELACLPMKAFDPEVHANAASSASDIPGFIITNPPYGIRLGEIEEAEALYAKMADFCTSLPGWKLALICNHKGFESHFGKKASSCRELKSGAVDTWLYQYDKL